MEPRDGITDRLVHRPCARRLLPLLVRLRASPNAVTLAGLLVVVASAAQFWHATPASAAFGVLLYVVAAVVDHADGDLARLTGQATVLGRWLDLAVDTAGNTLIVLGIAVTASADGHRRTSVLGLIATVGVAACAVLAHLLAGAASGPRGREPAVLKLANRDGFYLALLGFTGALAGPRWLVPPLLGLLAVGSTVYAAICLRHLASLRGQRGWGGDHGDDDR